MPHSGWRALTTYGQVFSGAPGALRTTKKYSIWAPSVSNASLCIGALRKEWLVGLRRCKVFKNELMYNDSGDSKFGAWFSNTLYYVSISRRSMQAILSEVAWRQRLQRQQGQTLRQLHTLSEVSTKTVLPMPGAKIELPLLID